MTLREHTRVTLHFTFYLICSNSEVLLCKTFGNILSGLSFFFPSWNFSYEQQMHHSLSDSCDLEQADEWKPTSDASRRMKRLSRSFMVIMARCRITAISLSHSPRFVRVHPAEQRPLHISFSQRGSKKINRARLRYGSAGRVLMRGDHHSWDNYKSLFVRWLYIYA